MKTIVNQKGNGLYTVTSGQFINVLPVTIENDALYSLGVNNMSFALYKDEKTAAEVFGSILDFLASADEKIFYMPKGW